MSTPASTQTSQSCPFNRADFIARALQEQIDRRVHHAEKARAFALNRRILKPGSLSYSVFDEMLKAFPTMEIPKGSPFRRVELAFEAALLTLGKTREDARRSCAIQDGKRIARNALKMTATED
jgi:hypothetical protein